MPVILESTVFDAILGSLGSSAAYNRDDTVPPAAVLWPDEKREWERLVPRLRGVMPGSTFGPYDPASRSGPAIWLRCVLAGKIGDVALSTGIVPIIYLPGGGSTTTRSTSTPGIVNRNGHRNTRVHGGGGESPWAAGFFSFSSLLISRMRGCLRNYLRSSSLGGRGSVRAACRAHSGLGRSLALPEIGY